MKIPTINIMDSIYILREIAKHDKYVWLLFAMVNKEFKAYFNTHGIEYELCFRSIIRYDNCIIYLLHSRYHRTDGPAIEYKNGDEAWYKNGRHHRPDDKPAVIHNGNKSWYNKGKLHRINKPAFIGKDGYKAWFINGKRHRLDGPAVIYPGGTEEYWINGVEATRPEAL